MLHDTESGRLEIRLSWFPRESTGPDQAEHGHCRRPQQFRTVDATLSRGVLSQPSHQQRACGRGPPRRAPTGLATVGDTVPRRHRLLDNSALVPLTYSPLPSAGSAGSPSTHCEPPRRPSARPPPPYKRCNGGKQLGPNQRAQ